MGLQDRQYYGEYSDDTSWRGGRAAPSIRITTILIVICVLVSLVNLLTTSSDAAMEKATEGMTAEDLQTPQGYRKVSVAKYPVNGNLELSTSPIELLWRPYTLLTYGFAHSPLDGANRGIMHIAFNMLGLYFFGNFCESLLGRNEYLRFYLIATVFAGLAFFLVGVATQTFSVVVGASGALMACIIYTAWRRPHEKVYLYGIVEAPLWGLAIAYVVMDLYGAIRQPNAGVAFSCHLGGALFATLYFKSGFNFGFLNFERFGAWRRQLQTRRHLSVHSEDQEEMSANISAEADRLLAKIQAQGASSLNQRERDLLERYSRQVRDKRFRRE